MLLFLRRIKHYSLSPPIALASGYIFLLFGGILLYFLGFFVGNDFYRWGPPVNIMGQEVTSQLTFYMLLFLFFGHELINSWISEVVYPYIINEVQDRKAKEIRYLKGAIYICLLFTVYSNLDLLIIVNGTYSQISFFLAIILSNALAVTYINYNYIRKKKKLNKDNTTELISVSIE